jgi:hypothetical protein
MKPLPSAPPGVMLTPEDRDTWQHVLHRFMRRPVPDLGGLSNQSDRLDFSHMRSAMLAYAQVGLTMKERHFLLARWGQDSWKL